MPMMQRGSFTERWKPAPSRCLWRGRPLGVGALRAGCRGAVLMDSCSAFSGTASDVTHLSSFSASVLTCTLADLRRVSHCSASQNVMVLSLISGPFKLCSYCLSVRSKGREESTLQTSPTAVHIVPGWETSQPVRFRGCLLLPALADPRQQHGCTCSRPGFINQP